MSQILILKLEKTQHLNNSLLLGHPLLTIIIQLKLKSDKPFLGLIPNAFIFCGQIIEENIFSKTTIRKKIVLK